MSSSFKTLALRLPRTAPSQHQTVVVQCCSKASMSTAARQVCLAKATTTPPRQNSNGNSVPMRRCGNGLAGSNQPMLRLVRTTTPAPSSPMSIASQARCFASSAALAASSEGASAATTTSTSKSKSNLDWDSFFKLRLRRRRIQLLFSVTSGLLGGAGGAILLSTGMAEPLVMQIPLDPFVTLGLMTFACAGMGWLVGPSLGNQMFYLMNHRLKAQMMQKESEFFTRVKKHRVNPTNSSASNPVPDFYGEKIQSVSGYRQWLKDQRAFNKKKTRAFV
ncbi:TIM23 complex component [Conoideocrella luteorostrata]|uniref:Presequence translocated-associated motor subunit PAM17 n=1 Tax=Conoideocrella luteorostrata TaxID=1105319 RepID=A0AAJ0G270_9HYPO|nr:TIM23 complex component [Conoideocrella luteorostrata]